MDLRPQAHDIIRTWLFSTVLRSHLEAGMLPWKNAAISGWVLDPDRKKMSKSKGNVITPMALLEEHGSDAVRYWAAKGGPGVDTAFDPGQMKIGRRLAIKLLNAAKFVLSRSSPMGEISEAFDRGMLQRLATLVDRATRHFDDYDYAAALREIEQFFWYFCDDYIELAKRPRAGDDAAAASANSAAHAALATLIRLLAPFLPFVTEEAWSWWQTGSVHRAAWPTRAEVEAALGGSSSEGREATISRHASMVTAAIRHQRSQAKLGFSAAVDVTLTVPEDIGSSWPLIERYVREGNNVAALSRHTGPELAVALTPHPAGGPDAPGDSRG
jgi:valyl-tRNA synthetase